MNEPLATFKELVEVSFAKKARVRIAQVTNRQSGRRFDRKHARWKKFARSHDLAGIKTENVFEAEINERWFKKYHERRYAIHNALAKEAEDSGDLDAALHHHKRAAHHAPTLAVRKHHVDKHREYKSLDLNQKSVASLNEPPNRPSHSRYQEEIEESINGDISPTFHEWAKGVPSTDQADFYRACMDAGFEREAGFVVDMEPDEFHDFAIKELGA